MLADTTRAAACFDASAAADGIRLRVDAVHTAREASALLAVLNQVWSAGGRPAHVIDLSTLVALAHSGNYVAQARLDGQLVGGGVGFFGSPAAPFHSHIVGVLPSATGKGVGLAIKLHQRAWSLDLGVQRMTWTFDPLIARNAAFNIRKLGARPETYLQDFYGEMTDGINSGQFSDRLLIGWELACSLPVVEDAPAAIPRTVVALDAADGAPGRFAPPPSDHHGDVLVGIPRDIEAIRAHDGGLAGDWRLAVREAFGRLLEEGWLVRDFRAGHYVFSRGSAASGGDR